MPLQQSDLAQFIGSMSFARYQQRVLLTEGIVYVAENGSKSEGGGAYWLIDAILSHQINPDVAGEPFQVWFLQTNLEDNTAVLWAEDGNEHELVRQEIPFTDFPLANLKLYHLQHPYAEQTTLLLPSEY